MLEGAHTLDAPVGPVQAGPTEMVVPALRAWCGPCAR
jgi:hypothetical protein